MPACAVLYRPVPSGAVPVRSLGGHAKVTPLRPGGGDQRHDPDDQHVC